MPHIKAAEEGQTYTGSPNVGTALLSLQPRHKAASNNSCQLAGSYLHNSAVAPVLRNLGNAAHRMKTDSVDALAQSLQSSNQASAFRLSKTLAPLHPSKLLPHCKHTLPHCKHIASKPNTLTHCHPRPDEEARHAAQGVAN